MRSWKIWKAIFNGSLQMWGTPNQGIHYSFVNISLSLNTPLTFIN